jgi:type I restriction enzyme S subunit
MRSGPFGSALLKEELAKEGIPFLGIDNVRTEEFVPSFKRFLTEAKFNELRRYEVFSHDVMITIMGTVGRACVVPEGTGQCVSSKHTWTMTFDRKKVAPEIICWQLNHFSGTRKKFLESSQGGVMDAISSQTLREIEVPIPTNKEYAEKLAEQYLSSSRYQQALKAKLAKIRLLKNAVSSDILSGRKRVTP